jgi:hypothetical protein
LADRPCRQPRRITLGPQQSCALREGRMRRGRGFAPAAPASRSPPKSGCRWEPQQVVRRIGSVGSSVARLFRPNRCRIPEDCRQAGQTLPRGTRDHPGNFQKALLGEYPAPTVSVGSFDPDRYFHTADCSCLKRVYSI